MNFYELKAVELHDAFSKNLRFVCHAIEEGNVLTICNFYWCLFMHVLLVDIAFISTVFEFLSLCLLSHFL